MAMAFSQPFADLVHRHNKARQLTGTLGDPARASPVGRYNVRPRLGGSQGRCTQAETSSAPLERQS